MTPSSSADIVRLLQRGLGLDNLYEIARACARLAESQPNRPELVAVWTACMTLARKVEPGEVIGEERGPVEADFAAAAADLLTDPSFEAYRRFGEAVWLTLKTE